MPYSFVRLYLFKCDECVLNYIWINPKSFLIILYVFGSDFYHSVFMFSTYFFFHCLSMFSVEKQVSEFLATIVSNEFWLLILATRLVTRPSHEFTQIGFTTHSQLILQLANCKTPWNSFLNGFSWETYFKPLPSSLKPLFQFFYIKT